MSIMETKRYDLIIIGAGPGGIRGARTALALSGWRPRELFGVDLSLHREATIGDFMYTLYESSTALVLEGLCVLLSLITAFLGSPEILVSELPIEVIILLFGVAIGIGAVVYQVRRVAGDGNTSKASIASFGRSIRSCKPGPQTELSKGDDYYENERRLASHLHPLRHYENGPWQV